MADPKDAPMVDPPATTSEAAADAPKKEADAAEAKKASSRSRSRSRSSSGTRSRSRSRSRSPRKKRSRSRSPAGGGGRRSLSPASKRLVERRREREERERGGGREMGSRGPPPRGRSRERDGGARRSPPIYRRGGRDASPPNRRSRSPHVSHAVARIAGVVREASAKDDFLGKDGKPKRHFANAAKPIVRAQTCPVLLRVFPSVGGHHEPSEYGRGSSELAKLPKDELQLHVYADTSLRELTTLVRQGYEPAQNQAAQLHFVLIFPGGNGAYTGRELGLVHANPKRMTREESRTLHDMKVMPGDYIDVAVRMVKGRVIG